MAKIDAVDVLKFGCALLGIGILLSFASSFGGVATFMAALAFVFFVAITIYGAMSTRNSEVRAINYEVPVVPVPRAAPAEAWDKKIRSIRSIYQSIAYELDKHQSQPAIAEMGGEIREQSMELVQQAEQVFASQRRLRTSISLATATPEQLEELETKMSAESDNRLRETLAATLDSKRAELANVSGMSDNARYLDALLDRAEAALSELRSRIGVTVAETDDYVYKERNAQLMDTSSQLRSVSEAMRVTLGELKS